MSKILDQKIEKLLNTSLFLSQEKKKFIREKLKTATEKEKKDLIKILKEDKKLLKEMVENYIQVNGSNKLENFLNQKSKKVIQDKHKTEDIKNLLS